MEIRPRGTPPSIAHQQQRRRQSCWDGTQDGHFQGNPYADASGISNDSLMLVCRVTLPGYQPPVK